MEDMLLANTDLKVSTATVGPGGANDLQSEYVKLLMC